MQTFWTLRTTESGGTARTVGSAVTGSMLPALHSVQAVSTARRLGISPLHTCSLLAGEASQPDMPPSVEPGTRPVHARTHSHAYWRMAPQVQCLQPHSEEAIQSYSIPVSLVSKGLVFDLSTISQTVAPAASALLRKFSIIPAILSGARPAAGPSHKDSCMFALVLTRSGGLDGRVFI